jgi:hypothetical protein
VGWRGFESDEGIQVVESWRGEVVVMHLIHYRASLCITTTSPSNEVWLERVLGEKYPDPVCGPVPGPRVHRPNRR